MNKIAIAIDGFSSTGKSSVSKEIAKQLDLIHLDTGALYRAVTLFAIQKYTKNDVICLEDFLENLDKIKLHVQFPQGLTQVFIDGKDVNNQIRKPIVSQHVSLIAKQKKVRDFLLTFQQDIAKHHGIVLDGRDIGTVVLPNADYKFFLTASQSQRTKRRLLELQQNGEQTNYEEVMQNLITRDKIDSEREIAPLKQAPDAVLIDNSDLNKEQTISLILSYIK